PAAETGRAPSNVPESTADQLKRPRRRSTTISQTPCAPDMSVTIARIELRKPVLAASGTFGYGVEFDDVVHLEKLGGIVVKGLSREPMAGNPPPRLYETAAGMLNAIGLQNIGARAFIEEKLPAVRQKRKVVIIANVF